MNTTLKIRRLLQQLCVELGKIDQELAAIDKPKLKPIPKTQKTEPGQPLKSAVVMQRLGFKDRKSFWLFVWREGVPCVRLSSRNVVFYESSLNAWLEKRSAGRAINATVAMVA